MTKVLTPVLVLQENGKPTRALSIRAANFVIGRDDGCDLVLPDPSVSERHAEIKAIGDKRIIDDLATRTARPPCRTLPSSLQPRARRPPSGRGRPKTGGGRT